MHITKIRKNKKRKINRKVKKKPSKSQMVGCEVIGYAGLTKDTYKLYLETKHWRDTRNKKLSKKPICEICNKEKAVQVHHLRYNDENGRTVLYREDVDFDLQSVCSNCHKLIHR
jgi:hypothetical protein